MLQTSRFTRAPRRACLLALLPALSVPATLLLPGNARACATCGCTLRR